MKKTLLTMALALIGVAGMSAETTPTYTLKFGDGYSTNQNQYIQSFTSTCDGTKWNIVHFSNNNNASSWNGSARCGRKDNPSTATIINDAAFPEQIEKMVISAYKAQSKATISGVTAKVEALKIEGETETVVETKNITSDVTSLSSTASNIVVEFTAPTANLYYRITFDCPEVGKNGAIAVQTVEYYKVSSGLADPEITFPQSSYDVKLGEPFDAPVATAKSGGTITYTSSDESVATVDAETGAVEILAAGTTTITAKIAATQTYSSGNAQYTISVTDPTVIFKWAKGGEEVFTFEQVSGTVQPWSYDSSYGLKGSAYKNGINACEAIAASPVIDLEGKKEITLNFRNAFNNYKVDNNMIDVADFPGKYAFIMVKEEGANDWTELCEPTAPTKFSWNFYDNDVISLDAYKDKRIQFGFKYVSTEDCAGTWEVDNIRVNGKVAVGVANIESEENVAPVYYNLQGVRVANPQNGLYIQVKGGKSSKVLVK